MALEIERKFLVADPEGMLAQAGESLHIVQGYLCRDPETTVRVRIINSTDAFLTVKGRNHGAVRHEYEYTIPVADAREMLAMAPGTIIDKHRHIIHHQGLRWEVDQFHRPRPMIVAEVELPDADTPIPRPAWLGNEVTGNPAYYNSNL